MISSFVDHTNSGRWGLLITCLAFLAALPGCRGSIFIPSVRHDLCEQVPGGAGAPVPVRFVPPGFKVWGTKPAEVAVIHPRPRFHPVPTGPVFHPQVFPEFAGTEPPSSEAPSPAPEVLAPPATSPSLLPVPRPAEGERSERSSDEEAFQKPTPSATRLRQTNTDAQPDIAADRGQGVLRFVGDDQESSSDSD